ncbi:MAG TPA: MFS transporter [Caulobacteraceae bacterium]|nr:MFS transporter [Caulobacteraceae bacterium]
MNKAADAARRISLPTILMFAAGALPLSGIGTAMSIYVQPYFAQDLGVGLIPIAVALFWIRIIDMGVDPILAIVMDRTKTPIGRYRAWMLAGAPILMLGVWELFMAPKGIGIAYLIVWYLVYALASSMVGLARAAWSANLVTKYDQRARFYGYLGFITVFGALFILLTPVISERLVKHPNNVHLMGWAMLALIPIATAITALVREPINADAAAQHPHFALRDYWSIATKPEVVRLFFSQFCLTLGPGWMANLYIFFFTNARLFTQGQASILLITYILAGVVGAPVIGYVGGRFGKHRTLIVSTILYSIGLCTVVVAPKANMLVGIPIMIWCGFMANGFDLMTGAMMADVGDQVRLEQGKERMALLYAVTGLAGKLAAAGAVIIAYPLLAAIGYQPTLGAHNTQAALDGLTIVFITGPIFWCVAGGLCFLGWKLDAQKHAQIRAELEARDTLVAQRAAAQARGASLPEHGALDPGVV